MRKKLTKNQENALIMDFKKGDYTQNELAIMYDIAQSTVSKIINSFKDNAREIPSIVFSNCNFNFGEVNYNNQAKQNSDNYKWEQVRQYEHLVIDCGDEYEND